MRIKFRSKKMDEKKKKTHKMAKNVKLKQQTPHNNKNKRILMESGSNHSHLKSNLDLFLAIEHGSLDEVSTLLEKERIDINCKGPLNLTPLECAVLNNNRSIVKYLLQKGASESNCCEEVIKGLKEELKNNISDGRSGLLKLSDETVSQKLLWEIKRKNIRKVLLGWDQLKKPEKPILFVEPVNQRSVVVSISLKENCPIITKVKVQWSQSPIFDTLNERIFAANPQNFKFTIPDLDPSARYFFRAFIGNIKEWSSVSSFSICCSSWKKSDQNARTFDKQKAHLDNLCTILQKINLHASQDVTGDVSYDKNSGVIKKKNAIHSLFNSVAPHKLSRNIKKGVYMACLVYSSHRAVFVVDDMVPLVEVCDTATTIAPPDFLWMMKISYSWFNLKRLKVILQQRETGNANWEMRKKLLGAVKQLQNVLGVTNLGQLYYKETHVSDEATVLTFVRQEDPTESPLSVSGKWLTLDKCQKNQQLTSLNIEDLIKFHDNAKIELSNGLYLGYLSLKSSLNSLYVMTSKANILPHCKIRQNSYVCAEEWEIISQNKVSGINKSYLTEIQLKFLQDLQMAVSELLKTLNGQADLTDLRFYSLEVVEINENVSFIIVCPQAEKFCQVINSKDELSLCNERSTYIPLKVFELLHTSLYQGEIANKYYELSCTLDLEIQLATQSSREALSTAEIEQTRTKLNKLQEVAESCKEFWKNINWLGNLVKFAQNKDSVKEPTLRNILEFKKLSDASPHKRTPVKSQANTSSQSTSSATETSIVQVYAAYDTGLPSGTSLKLRVTPQTTCREVIDLVVKQLNMAVVLKGKEGPIYSSEELQNFCLVAIIGARERCLRDEFRLLQLQNPFKKGTLYVRQKHDLLAAIEHSNHQTAI
ncbi:ankyrin-repeat and fibronectin type III domain-containing 1 [Culicoides brevitarsis]|uniref:ankyrin-repeat and fibronectin type III domain-containing 1 n=1 Tax=Culicoides brevitarsis TaxID=469753 RepID=UPI00307C2D85